MTKLLPAVFLFLTPALCQPPDTSPQTLYLHGNILTGQALLSDHPTRVSALAVTNHTIVATGTDNEILKLRGPHTQLVDLAGAFVMPGFNDAHTHIAEAGQQKLSVDLDGTTSLAEMLSRIERYTATARPNQWILGAGWDQTKWSSHTLPTRQDLDKVTPGHPAVFYRTDGHIVVANSAALNAAHINSETLAPPGSQIDHDPAGGPTGIVREDPAIQLIYKQVPPPDPDTRRRALDLAIADALAHGVTSLQDFSTWDDWLTLESMEHRDQLPIRISEWLAFDTPLEVLKQRRASHPADDPLLHLGFLKAFMDGSLGSRTAALQDPYSDDPDNSGLPRYDQENLNQLAEARAAAGFQLGFHAIGDEANTIALNAFAAAEQSGRPANQSAPQPKDSNIATFTNPAASEPGAPGLASETWVPKDFRFRIEHAQVLLPGDFTRFHDLGVIASMQPSHLLTDMAWAPARLGPERSQYAYAWRSMLDHHVPLAFGTDYPVESISPFRGLYAAITRQNEAGTQTFHPEQRITLPEAILAYTQTSAYAEFREQIKGVLAPGYLADFIVLDRDLLASNPRQILGTKVLRTIVGGRTVYLAPGQPTIPGHQIQVTTPTPE